jgi:hypothetical protein
MLYSLADNVAKYPPPSQIHKKRMDNLTVAQGIKCFDVIYRTRRLTAVFATAHNNLLSWATWIRSTVAHPAEQRSVSCQVRTEFLYIWINSKPKRVTLMISFWICMWQVQGSHIFLPSITSGSVAFFLRLSYKAAWRISYLKRIY